MVKKMFARRINFKQVFIIAVLQTLSLSLIVLTFLQKYQIERMKGQLGRFIFFCLLYFGLWQLLASWVRQKWSAAISVTFTSCLFLFYPMFYTFWLGGSVVSVAVGILLFFSFLIPNIGRYYMNRRVSQKTDAPQSIP